MPQKYRLSVYLDDTHPILIARVFGPMPSDELCEAFLRAYAEIGEPWLYDRLIDMRRYTGHMEDADTARFARVWADWTRDVPQGRRVAFVTHDPVEQETIRTNHALYPKDTMRNFDTADEALDWLTGRDADIAFIPQPLQA
ncbi:hypothetical protein [Asticcacaulis sp. AND118]|uniref:hypothetical protein n=1 Tax=Asticcacaulis sp. AND118 TaxID=2840468 RepID=UPI001CFF8E28|nr:hypothetical protein [Asticcacaulis sp. AND118]UDF02254.1 hypothetical protein LH365_07265 [Asticcacaulis sp. AND118]